VKIVRRVKGTGGAHSEEHDRKRAYRVRSAVGGKPRRHGGRWRDKRHEASQALEERRGVGRVVGETKPTPPRGESGGRAEGAAGGGAVAIWVEREGKAREGSFQKPRGLVQSVVVVVLVAAVNSAHGDGMGWDGMVCDGREGWVGPGGVGVGWRCVMKRGAHWLAGLVGGSPLAARFPPHQPTPPQRT
jgi:hypothetical protein